MLYKSKNIKSLWNIRLQEDELDRDLTKLIVQIKKYKTMAECGEDELQSEAAVTANIEFDIHEISRKIGLLEQIIAESTTESEIVKKYYYAKRNMKKRYEGQTETANETKIRERSTENVKSIASIQAKQTSISNPSLYYSTMSTFFHNSDRTSYSRPPKTAYVKDLNKTHGFAANRQPMGRSSYQCEFLEYGALPVYIFKQNEGAVTSCKSVVKNSTYQADFKPEKTSLINPYTLDCRQDKIKYIST